MLGTQTYGVELGLVDPVSRKCDWVWYHVEGMEHDTSIRQHKWALRFMSQPDTFGCDGIIMFESDVKSEQTYIYLYLQIWIFRWRMLRIFPDVHWLKMKGCNRKYWSLKDRYRRIVTKPTKWMCAQRRLRSAWASTESDQSLHLRLMGS